MSLIIRFLCLGLLTGSAASQSGIESVQVADLSEPDAPLKISGHVNFSDDESEALPYSVEIDTAISNVSSKPILLSVVQLELVSTHVRSNVSEEDDYFFRPNILEPDSHADLRLTLPGGRSSAAYKAAQVKPRADARVEFVQFLDGSTWGNPVSARRVMEDRNLSLKTLHSLFENYQNGDEQRFREELLRPTDLQPLLTLQNFIKRAEI